MPPSCLSKRVVYRLHVLGPCYVVYRVIKQSSRSASEGVIAGLGRSTEQITSQFWEITSALIKGSDRRTDRLELKGRGRGDVLLDTPPPPPHPPSVLQRGFVDFLITSCLLLFFPLKTTSLRILIFQLRLPCCNNI